MCIKGTSHNCTLSEVERRGTVSELMTKHEMTEEDIKLQYITPAIESAGWDTVVLRAVLPNGKKVRGYRVFREVCASQVSFEFFYHSERPPFTMIIPCPFYSPLTNGNNSSIRWTMRRCSLSGGSGKSAFDTLSLFKFFTTAPLTLSRNW